MVLTYDLGGNDLVVNSITTGASTPGSTSTGSNSLVGGSGVVNTINATAATLALTASNTGATIILNRAAGVTITLPAPVVGTVYKFVVGTVATSNQHKVITSAGTIFLTGGLYFDKSLTITRYDGDNATNVSVKLNGTTTGGATIGDVFSVTCVSATSWTVEGTVTASGTLATPFATS